MKTMGNFNRGGGRPGGGGRNFGRRDFGDRGRGFGGGFGRDSGRREMFNATCSNCGKECQVPFRPTNGKPVYCSECFEKMNGGGSDSRRFDNRDRSPQSQGGPNLSAIEAKLDKILSILEPKAATPVISTPAVQEEKVTEEVKSPKVKKAVKKVASTKKK